MSTTSFCLAHIVLALAVFLPAANASEQAHNPTVPDGAADVDPEVTLGWHPGDSAQVHYVFLSTDHVAVTDRRVRPTAVDGHDNTSFDPAGLLLGETYYWAVHEQFSYWITPGTLWQFTVAHSRVVDDMERYDNEANYVWDAWFDGCGDAEGLVSNGTGSCIWSDSDVAGRGEKSMFFAYDNSAPGRRWPYSEAKRTFAEPQVWTRRNEKALALEFYGSSDNDTEPMYLAVEDGNVCVVLKYGADGQDPDDVKNEHWQQWNIDLRDLVSEGLDLSHVVSIAIGFGERENPQVGGSGIVYFDEIRLYGRRCVPEYGPAGDLSGNCVVDVPDLRIMAGQWLESGSLAANLYPDDVVDFKDYAVLVNNWSAQAEPWPLP